MTPEKLFHQMLGLANEWQVVDCRFDENNGVFLEIKETPGLWQKLRCPKDGGEVSCYDHTEVLDWRHLNVFEHHWVRDVAQLAPPAIFRPMLRASKTVFRHLGGIMAHWHHRLTNAYMEGLNSVFSATKRKARGYRKTEYLLTMLYLVAGKLRIPFH